MTNHNPHIIKTQVFDVMTDGQGDTFSLQHRLSSFFYQVVLPVLEKTFDELAPGEETIYLDCIEIDLGWMTPVELGKNKWPEKIKEILYRQLKEAIQAQKTKRLPDKTTHSISRQWLYYMEHGFLPWNMLNTDKRWYEKVLEELAGNYQSIDLLRKLIRHDAKAVSRIVLLHTPVYLGHLVEVLTAQKQVNLALLMTTIEKMLDSYQLLHPGTRKPRISAKQIWERILLFTSTDAGNLSEEMIIQKIVLAALGKIQLIQLLREEPVLPRIRGFIPFIKEQLARQTGNIAEAKAGDPVNDKDAINERVKIPEEGIFVKHAGLVIMHPFLNQLFSFLKFTENGKFKSRAEHQKALAILYWMATGNNGFEEHELVVHKVLCGYPLGLPVDPGTMITPAEADEALRLLESVTAQWSILKNTSVTALQESFLQRGGKLINVSNGDIRLMVEADALDVLLDYLPWGFSMIKLPWMPQLLKVEWR